MTSTVGAQCLLCNMVVDSFIGECSCGNLAVKSMDTECSSLAIFVDDITTVELKKVYLSKGGQMVKMSPYADIQFGKYFILGDNNGNN